MNKRLWILVFLLFIALALPVAANAVTVDSGVCGSSLNWMLTDAGVLTIFGTGQMDNYAITWKYGEAITTAPWGFAPKQVVIRSGVTGISDYAFYQCYNLTSVTIPSSVTSIGNHAFSDCSSLPNVTIPSSVTSIGDYAFQGCSSLTGITIPNGVTSIGKAAFTSCDNLTKINVASGNQHYCSVNGVLLNKAKTKLIQCPVGMTGTYDIPSTVTSIGDSAFSGCSGLTNVTIPNSVTSIGSNAFGSCSGLTSVTIPSSVTSIGEWAFYNCSSLTSVTIPDSVTSIGNSAFCECISLSYVTIPDRLTSIGNELFYHCDLRKISIPSSVTNIGLCAFAYCSSLYSIVIPNSVTSIDDSAFSGHSDDLVIACYAGSSAQEHAASHNIKVWLMTEPVEKPVITGQPASKTVNEGNTATFKVTATGATGYQWYYRNSSSDAWKSMGSGYKADTMSFTAKAAHTGHQYRCLVKNSAGSVYSSTVTLTVKSKPVITAQPASKTVNEGNTATFKVTATGATGYQWYYRNSSSDAWKSMGSGYTAATMSFTAKASHTGHQYRCLVKNSAGSVYSSTVTLTVNAKPVITRQPASAKVDPGKTVTFKVTAAGATSYQWYYRNSSADTWTAITTKGTSASFVMTAQAKYSGRQYRCLVKNSAGSVYTNTVTLTVNSKPVITVQPASVTVTSGKTVTFKVTAAGATSYQWYYRNSSADAWTVIANKGTSSSFTMSGLAKYSGRQYRCEVKNALGSTYSGIATLTVK